MKIAYFDAFSGASGDMILGALVDAGLPLEVLQEGLKGLGVEGFEVVTYPVIRRGLRATKVDVVIPREDYPARAWQDLREIIQGSDLPPVVREQGIRIFTRLAEAEARVHGIPVEEVHFHELGSLDTLVDVMGAVIGLHYLGVETVWVSPLNVGGGMGKGQHGPFPVPAPATLELLRGWPIRSSGIPHEILTPTGAAILTTLARAAGPLPPMTLEAVGLGAGSRDLPQQPNVLRMFLGEEAGPADEALEALLLLETNLDDLNPQIFPHLQERLLDAGARDVWVLPVVMKKGRPGHQVSVLVPQEATDRALEILFQETSTLGIRIREVRRVRLDREIRTLDLPFGMIRVKVARRGGKILRITPELEDCRQVARHRGLPLQEVLERVRREARKLLIPEEWVGPRAPSPDSPPPPGPPEGPDPPA